ncbi:hypothetical protein OC834_004231 [Tilletia horrida]|nr:hypothetical protein OC834_004231 [Tilletia horrida]
MQLFKSVLAATAALAASVALIAPAAIAAGTLDLPRDVAALDRRGPIHDIIHILKSKKKTGSAFCSTFLGLPPYAATKTVTVTATAARTLSASKKTAPTEAAAPTSTITARPSAEVHVVRNMHRAHPTHDPTRTRLPHWLNQYSCPKVSKACSHIVTSKTKTVSKTVTATATGTPYVPTSEAVVLRLTRQDTGAFFGYVSPKLYSGINKVTQDKSAALVVTPSKEIAKGGPFNLVVAASAGYMYPFLGPSTDAGNLGPGLSNYLYMNNVDGVPAGKRSIDRTRNSYAQSRGLDTLADYQSQVWYINRSTGKVTIIWTNTTGSEYGVALWPGFKREMLILFVRAPPLLTCLTWTAPPPPTLVFEYGKSLVWTGNVTDFKQTYDENAVLLDITFRPAK